MAIDKTNKTLVEYNAKNGQYQIGSGSVSSLTYLSSVSISRNIASESLYGDGEEQDLLISESGITGSLVMTARDEEFEKDLGFVEELSAGQGSKLIKELPVVNIYAEIYFKQAGVVSKVKKAWFLNARVSPPNEAYNQSTGSLNTNAVEYPITIIGVNKKTTDGTADYVNAVTGDTEKVWRVTSIPTDAGYSAFGNTVPVPKQKAAQG